jgi:pyrroline-5-carboxylate reductase
MSQHIAFLGGGNMATAMISGLVKQGWPPSAIYVVEIDALARERLSAFGVHSHAQWPESQKFDVVVLAVKPQQMQSALRSITEHLKNSLIISIAAGLTLANLSTWLNAHTRIVRCMPNTPALVGLGMTVATPSSACSEADRELASKVLSASGQFFWARDEDTLNPVTAISGSGPGYVFYLMEWLEKAALELGFDEQQAHQLVTQTFRGAAELSAQSPDSFATLREKVTSKGGTTAAGLAVLEQRSVGASIVEAAKAANRRSIELGKN